MLLILLKHALTTLLWSAAALEEPCGAELCSMEEWWRCGEATLGILCLLHWFVHLLPDIELFLHTPHVFCFLLTPHAASGLQICLPPSTSQGGVGLFQRRQAAPIPLPTPGDGYLLPHPLSLSSQGLHPCLPGSAGMDVPPPPAGGCWASSQEGRVISRHHPSHAFCSATPAMPNICISHRQTGLHHSSILLRIFLNTWDVQLHENWF